MLDFSHPGKPTDNAFVENCNGRLRDECLNAQWFLSLADTWTKIEAWRRDYNENRSHVSLGWHRSCCHRGQDRRWMNAGNSPSRPIDVMAAI